jgi:predicted ATPase
VLSELADPVRAPEVLNLRERVRSWRFYDHFRTDPDAPARRTQVGTRTFALADDGRDLAAALQTIRENGDDRALDDAVADAFPGARVEVVVDGHGFSVVLHQHGLLRPLAAAELSDGTLRYLMWVAALLTPRPPELLVVNEPETSLHADLLPALGRLIGRAAQQTQVWVVTHARALVDALAQQPGHVGVRLGKELGETVVVDRSALELPPWEWPAR